MNPNRLLPCLALASFLPFVGCAGGSGMMDTAPQRGGYGGGMMQQAPQDGGGESPLGFMSHKRAAPADAPSVLDAAAIGNLAGVDSALSSGGDVNARNANGATALQLAAAGGYLPVVQTLLAHGAAVNAADNNGMTALSAATAGGYADVARALVASGANGGPAPAAAAPASGGQGWWQSH